MTPSRHPERKEALAPWQAVVFDIEGVIAHQDAAVADPLLRALRSDLTVAELRRVRDSEALYPLWLRYSTGRLTPRAYWSRVLAALAIPPTRAAIERLRMIQQQTWWAAIDAHVVALLRRLRARPLRLATLSNSAPEHEGQLAALEPLFDGMHFSHRTGYRKPAVTAYRHLLQELGVAAAGTVFVDDKPRNVEAAQRLGMTGIVFRSADQLEAELLQLGVLTDEEAATS